MGTPARTFLLLKARSQRRMPALNQKPMPRRTCPSRRRNLKPKSIRDKSRSKRPDLRHRQEAPPVRLAPPESARQDADAAPRKQAGDVSSSQIDSAVLRRVKAATVHFKVTVPDGRIAQGRGFVTDEPCLFITSAHVVQMLDPESRKPTRIEVTTHSGTDKTRTTVGKVVGVDRGSDLALVRVEGNDPPAPLKLGATKGLSETMS